MGSGEWFFASIADRVPTLFYRGIVMKPRTGGFSQIRWKRILHSRSREIVQIRGSMTRSAIPRTGSRKPPVKGAREKVQNECEPETADHPGDGTNR